MLFRFVLAVAVNLLAIAIYVAFAFVLASSSLYACMFDGCHVKEQTVYITYSILALLSVSAAALVSVPFALRATGVKRILLILWPLVFFAVSPLVQPVIGGDAKLTYPEPWASLGFGILMLGGPIGALALAYAIKPRWR